MSLAPSIRERPWTFVAPSDPLDFCRGLALALPLSLLLWVAILRVAWWVWQV
jgi:hypothetical protein